MLILDLDDTIFRTNSMNPQLFDSALSVVKNYYSESKYDVETVVAELWSKPLDVVLSKYEMPDFLVSEFYDEIENVDFRRLDIRPFADYNNLQSLEIEKMLVTTGLKKLQEAKISALGIRSDFEAIFIDDPRLNPRKHKSEIFKQILSETNKTPQELWVIGDNPESEIKAGKTLGMRTIQRRSSTKNSSAYSDFEIDSFEEIRGIIGG